MIVLKVPKKAVFHPLFRRYIFGKTSVRVILTHPPAFSGLANLVVFTSNLKHYSNLFYTILDLLLLEKIKILLIFWHNNVTTCFLNFFFLNICTAFLQVYLKSLKREKLELAPWQRKMISTNINFVRCMVYIL